MKAGKGLRGTARRASLLPARYGLTPDKLRTRIRAMTADLSRWEATPTVPVTANALDRHPEIAGDLVGCDSAIHGYRHVRYAGLSEAAQSHDLDLASRAFRNHQVPVQGFRAPYLAADATTRALLKSRGFAYDSSSPSMALPTDHPAAGEIVRLAEARYGDVPSGPARPTLEGGLVELPVALPDDEILIDGLGIDNEEGLGRIFQAMLRPALDAGALLVLQIHPERFHLCSKAIGGVLRSATDGGAWIAPLSEIASHVRASPSGWPAGHAMALAVTGDLDAVSLLDFARRVWEG